MKLSDLTCENLDIDFGAGSSEVINVTCKNEADFDLGVGKQFSKTALLTIPTLTAG